MCLEPGQNLIEVAAEKLKPYQQVSFERVRFEDWEASQSDEQINLADRRIKELTTLIREFIFHKFKRIYGEANDAYWEYGVTNKDMKTNAYGRRIDDPPDKRLPLEVYLELIELKKIVENKTHWPHFKDVFNIPLPGAKKRAKDLAWMERLNELRRIPGHPAKQRSYRTEDFRFLEWLYPEFTNRLKNAKSQSASE